MAKVLVVDDSLSVRTVVERALVSRQMEVVSAASGREALERIERDEPDVVVCDVVMPDRDGYEICEFVKSHPRLGNTPVLLMSGLVNDEVRARAARARSSDIMPKPFAAADLVRKLETLLAARARPSAAPATAGGAGAILAHFGAMDGVQWAVLADREGFLVEATAEAGVDAEIAGALSACLAEACDGLGRELGRGALQGMILEYEKGFVVLYNVGPSGLLAVALTEAAALGKVRYYARKALPELAQAI